MRIHLIASTFVLGPALAACTTSDTDVPADSGTDTEPADRDLSDEGALELSPYLCDDPGNLQTLLDALEKLPENQRKIIWADALSSDGVVPSEDLAREFGIVLAGVPVIGDSERDLEAARAVGARPILVLTGKGVKTAAELRRRGDSAETFANLEAAAAQLIAESGEKVS